jgi:hypothetical protein
MKQVRRLIFVVAAIISLAVTVTVFADSLNFNTHLSAAEEVMPITVVVANDSLAQGQANFKLSSDGLTLHYKLIAANIDNAFMAHIHIGPAGANGPIAVWLFPSTTPGAPGPLGAGRKDGVLAEGDITAADFVVPGPLAGQPLSALIDAIQAGRAYVNIHTNDGVAPTNTGPGDFPGGEIRGQLEMHNH